MFRTRGGMQIKSGKKAQHTVLVVADDRRVLLLAQAVLAGKGHRVLLASDACRTSAWPAASHGAWALPLMVCNLHATMYASLSLFPGARSMSDLAQLSFDFTSLQAAHVGGATPADVADEICRRMDKHADNPIWIARVPRERLLHRARSLGEDAKAGTMLPLYGLPFAVKDNIDAAGLPTTAGCP